MPEDKLTLGEQITLTIHRLAQAKGISESEVLRRAVATYAALQKYPEVWVKLSAADGSTPPNNTGLSKIVLP